MESQSLRCSVSEFISLTNQIFEGAYPSVEIEGEVASFKVNQNKFVFFDIKDNESSLGCFMMVFALRMPIEDGMKVIVKAVPKLTKWGKFSLTVQQIRPSGEGSLKKSFDLLKAKLEKEGLFATDRKRQLPRIPKRIAIVSSVQSAGYADFIKILNERWAGLEAVVAHVQVQGDVAPDQMIRALEYINQEEKLPDVIVLIRGGGSADDLSAFNDERLVRAVAASRVPILTGIGHEIDESLCDLAADVRAATPSNAAQVLTPDKREIHAEARQALSSIIINIENTANAIKRESQFQLSRSLSRIEYRYSILQHNLESKRQLLSAYDPRNALQRGYAIVRGEAKKGDTIEVDTYQYQITAEVLDVKKR